MGEEDRTRRSGPRQEWTRGAVETLTVLFCDLVDSTRISVALDAAGNAHLRGSLFGILREEVERVDGSQVKSLGDGIMAVFPNAASGLTAAVAIQRRVEHLDRRFAEPIRLRIGLSAGDVEFDDGDWYGEPVVEAARLCDVAPAGGILVGELVRLLAGRAVAFDFGELVEHDLKGLPDPVPARPVEWLPLEQHAVPLRWPTSSAADPLVGRSSEVARFGRVLASVEDGSSRVVSLTGESGVGKSRLAEDLARLAHDRGAVVVVGRAREELLVPFGPYREALAHLVAHLDVSILAEHVGEHGAELGRLVPELAARLGSLEEPAPTDPETELYRLYRAVVGLLTDLASARPVVLVLDDLHLADRSTVHLTRFLADEAVPGLMLLTVYRRGELDADNPLNDMRAEQSAAGRLVALDLDGLDTGGVATLVEQVVGHPLPAPARRIADVIARETDGNPFFVTEMVRHLREEGGIGFDGQPSPDDAGIAATLPTTVLEVVRRRVQRLGDATGRVLAAAAVLGLEFDLGVLATLAGIEDDALVDHLERATAAGLLRPSSRHAGTCSFAHGIVGRTLYGDLSVLRRSQLHRHAAQVLQRLVGGEPAAVTDLSAVAEVARHAYEGRDRMTTRAAIAWAREAGRRADGQLAPGEAIRWFERALEMADEVEPDVELVGELLLSLGVAQRDAGLGVYVDTLRRAAGLARELGSPDLRAEVALANFRGFWSSSGSVDPERIDELQEARAAFGDGDHPAAAKLLATTAVELGFGEDPEARLVLSDEAVAMGRRLGQPATLAYLLRSWELVHRLPWFLDERVRVAEEHHRLAQALDDPVEWFWAVNSYSIVALEHGDAALFQQLVPQVLPAAAATGQRLLEWIGGFVAINAHLIEGRADEAEALMERTHEVGQEAGMPDVDEVYASHLFEIRRAQGRVDELVDLLVAVVEAAPDIEAFRPALGICYRDLGRRDGHDLFREDVVDGFARYRHNGLWLASMTMNAELAAFFDDEEAALLLHERLVPWRDQVVWTGTTAGRSVAGAVGQVAVTLGRFDEAEDLLTQAVEVHRALRAPAWTAESLLAAAVMYSTRGGPGDEGRARESLAEAVALAASVGAGSIQHRAELVAARVG
ncbi:ATP-binding protein [Dermatobacter hominis]|uniref:ATP-binding protein n=1 Tax=Dermatobacter hominis TaxID=2884263 RepID=UPI001D112D5C|nr:AAA family ATPase [Dermatobacter hominis]UDY37976.1 AAA family ATPase [Dermatobacter hominis]